MISTNLDQLLKVFAPQSDRGPAPLGPPFDSHFRDRNPAEPFSPASLAPRPNDSEQPFDRQSSSEAEPPTQKPVAGEAHDASRQDETATSGRVNERERVHDSDASNVSAMTGNGSTGESVTGPKDAEVSEATNGEKPADEKPTDGVKPSSEETGAAVDQPRDEDSEGPDADAAASEAAVAASSDGPTVIEESPDDSENLTGEPKATESRQSRQATSQQIQERAADDAAANADGADGEAKNTDRRAATDAVSIKSQSDSDLADLAGERESDEEGSVQSKQQGSDEGGTKPNRASAQADQTGVTKAAEQPTVNAAAAADTAQRDAQTEAKQHKAASTEIGESSADTDTQRNSPRTAGSRANVSPQIAAAVAEAKLSETAGALSPESSTNSATKKTAANAKESLLTSLTRFERGAQFGPRGAQRGDGQNVPQVDPSRFVSRVARAIYTAQQRGGPLQLRLSPPELGSLRLELSVKQGVLTASVEAETSTAKQVLLDNLPALRDRLAEQNVRIERFDVDVRRDSGGEQPQFGTQQHNQQEHRHNTRSHPTSNQHGLGRNETADEVAATPRPITDTSINVIA